MSEKFELVKHYLYEMGLPIVQEEPAEELVVVENEENGIKNLVIDCEDSIVILEQVIMPVPAETGSLFERLLKLNRELVHGAFVLDEDAKVVIFRDTLASWPTWTVMSWKDPSGLWNWPWPNTGPSSSAI